MEREWYTVSLLAISIFLLLTAGFLVLYLRRELLSYSQKLSDCLDDMIVGKENIIFEEEKDTLIGKLQAKLQQFNIIKKEKEETAVKERQALERTLSDVSHQIKTPMANIRMYQNLLQEEPLSKETRRQFLNAQERQLDKLEFLLEAMIKMSRLEAGILKMHPSKTVVHSLIEQAVCDAALKGEQKDISISVLCSEELTAWLDPKWTGEALFNLLDNAVKYTPEHGRIQISAIATDFYIRIQVTDSGLGILEEEYTEIFKRFYRGAQVASEEGVGIGLYLAREIISRQSGYLEVSSRPGEGSTFSINLPIEPC